ncbi:MAG: FHA domain-containing protein [Gemmatimonadales bacterium]
MMHLEVGGKRVPVAAGETVIGSGQGCAIVLEGVAVRPRHAIVQGSAAGAAIRSAAPDADLRVNGVLLGADPTPLLHGDKIQIAEHEILAVDPKRAGHTQLFDSGAFADLAPFPRPSRSAPSTASGGRLVCLTDGREYTVGSAPLVFGRDAGSDVVVTGNEVSRRHAEIQATGEGYVLMDLSVNGSFVNGQRVGRSHLLARADIIRIGHDEFRFYADAAPALAPMPPRRPPEGGPARPPTGAGARLSDTMHGLPSSELKGVPTPPAPEAVVLASLMVRSGDLKGQRFAVRTAVTNIGRADYNDVVILEPSVSTSHAKLQRRESVWVLTDLDSTNGTFVDGEPVTGEMPLSPGATIRFGEVSVLFEPLDDRVASSRPQGTRLIEKVDVMPPGPPEPEATEAEPVRERGPSPRRPIRASTPRPSGPPAWLIALLALAAAIIAFLLLRSS